MSAQYMLKTQDIEDHSKLIIHSASKQQQKMKAGFLNPNMVAMRYLKTFKSHFLKQLPVQNTSRKFLVNSYCSSSDINIQKWQRAKILQMPKKPKISRGYNSKPPGS